MNNLTKILLCSLTLAFPLASSAEEKIFRNIPNASCTSYHGTGSSPSVDQCFNSTLICTVGASGEVLGCRLKLNNQAYEIKCSKRDLKSNFVNGSYHFTRRGNTLLHTSSCLYDPQALKPKK